MSTAVKYPGILTIDGRSFRVFGMGTHSPEHLRFTEEILEECGLQGLMPVRGETQRQFAARAYSVAVRKGRPVFDFLGTIMLPIELNSHEWTPAVARANGEFFASRTDMQDILLLQRALMGLFNAFAPKFHQFCAALMAAPTSSLALVN